MTVSPQRLKAQQHVATLFERYRVLRNLHKIPTALNVYVFKDGVTDAQRTQTDAAALAYFTAKAEDAPKARDYDVRETNDRRVRDTGQGMYL